jgi:S1-C subfamily serine protease
MKCPSCGNQSLLEHGQDLICEFCRTVAFNPQPVETIHAASEIIESQANIPSIKQDWQSTYQSVLTIKNEDHVGTGFVLNESGWVLTNYHVVNQAEVVYGQFDGSDINYPLYPIHWGDEDLDLCLLQIDSNNSFVPISWSKEPPSLGDEVVTIGNPHGIGLSMSKGVISRLDDENNLQLNMQLNPGNSGGPVMNHQGEVLGIVSYLIKEISAMSFAIGMEQIEEFINEFEGEEDHVWE